MIPFAKRPEYMFELNLRKINHDHMCAFPKPFLFGIFMKYVMCAIVSVLIDSFLFQMNN